MCALPSLQRRRRPHRTGQGLQDHAGCVVGPLGTADRPGRWPVKSAKLLHRLLKNAASNASANELDIEDSYIKSIVVQQAPKTRRRTYRAHGRMCVPRRCECR